MANVSFSYQWLANDAEIAGATDPTYTLVDDDAGQTIKVKVSFFDDKNHQESLTSAATAAVLANFPGAPEHLNVSLRDTGALDVSWEAPATDGGSAITEYRGQWKETAGNWDTPADVTEETATGTTHTITGLIDGVEYAVRIIAVNDVGEGPPSDEAMGTPRETTPPELSTATVDGATLTLTYDEDLDENSEPSSDAFSVTVGGTGRAVDGVSVSGSSVILTEARKGIGAYLAFYNQERPHQALGYRSPGQVFQAVSPQRCLLEHPRALPSDEGLRDTPAVDSLILASPLP